MIPPEVEAAYRRTTYRVDAPGGPIALRIGERSHALDALLRGLLCESWAFVSAANPASRLLPEADNAQRHQALAARLNDAGWTWYSGCGIADDGGWREQSAWVAGISAADAAALGRAFGQNAVVAGRLDDVAELLWCEP